MNYKQVMAIKLHEAGGEYFESIPVFYEFNDQYLKVEYCASHMEGDKYIGGTLDITAVDSMNVAYNFEIDPYSYLYVIDQETCDHRFYISQNADKVDRLCSVCGKRIPIPTFAERPSYEAVQQYAVEHGGVGFCLKDFDEKYILVDQQIDVIGLRENGWQMASAKFPFEVPPDAPPYYMRPDSNEPSISPEVAGMRSFANLFSESQTPVPSRKWNVTYSSYDEDTDTELIVEYSNLEGNWYFNVHVSVSNPDLSRMKYRSDAIYATSVLALVAAEKWFESDAKTNQ